MNTWWVLGGAAALLTSVAEIAFRDAAHAYYWWHTVPLFDLVYGFASCAAIVLVSKALGSAWLERPEDYYDEERR